MKGWFAVELKKRQIIVVSLVLMIIAAGYLNYSYRKNTEGGLFPLAKHDSKIGNPVYVENNIQNELDTVAVNGKKAADTGDQSDVKKGDYFSETRFERQRAREAEVDRLDDIIGSVNVSKEERELVSKNINRIITNSDKEMVLEKLIIAKGFEDCIVFISDDMVDVVVKTTSLTEKNVAQIVDIVCRQTKVPASNIRITERN